MNSETKPDATIAAPPPDLEVMVPADLIQGMRDELAALRASRDRDSAFLSRLQQSVPTHGFSSSQVPPHATSSLDFAPAESQADPRDHTGGSVGPVPVRPYLPGSEGLLFPQSATGTRPDWSVPTFAQRHGDNGTSAPLRYAAPAPEPPKATRFASSRIRIFALVVPDAPVKRSVLPVITAVRPTETTPTLIVSLRTAR